MADTQRTVEVDFVNVSKRLVVASDGTVGNIRVFLDTDGEETDDIELAAVAIVAWPNGDYSPVDLADYEYRPFN